MSMLLCKRGLSAQGSRLHDDANGGASWSFSPSVYMRAPLGGPESAVLKVGSGFENIIRELRFQ